LRKIFWWGRYSVAFHKLWNMPSVMEDPHVVHVGPTPRETLPLNAYDVQLVSGSLARMIPIHSACEVSKSLIVFLANEMNDEVPAFIPMRPNCDN